MNDSTKCPDGSTLEIEYSPEFVAYAAKVLGQEPSNISSNDIRRVIHSAFKNALDRHLEAQATDIE